MYMNKTQFSKKKGHRNYLGKPVSYHIQTSPTLASNLYCLARYPDAQERLYNEITKVVPPGEQITADRINSMAYLKAFVKETFRY